ncbi:hypothetical protein G7B40_028515 [Aetokthonos hydrillicola Thurmond2011]|uniref:Uncharacterized protein n=1 Tax=Aetokthonos hydrillicola Thurmond2011 TaxID=2712845 RepID=A0AAP5MCL2_9CYAN|nr:hypothetical protein [Aetokthonos hydrillicola]MBO3464086.1 hypothetical protein [Aetokthonos hydrillicola CCALA 1050]MBW4584319.1 hypothetical protein [Aetokthonos hydrillicola CCALA 1050]MDR9898473.1 hypothetical protein [Aetokthonos hydrillicola Thurmond2011]
MQLEFIPVEKFYVAIIGWKLDGDRKPIRTEKFSQRSHFTQHLRSHLQQWL